MDEPGFKRQITNLNDSIRDLGGWNDGVGGHHPVRVFLTDLRD